MKQYLYLDDISRACVIVRLDPEFDFDDFVEQQHYRRLFGFLAKQGDAVTILFDGEAHLVEQCSSLIKPYGFRIDSLQAFESRSGTSPAWGIGESSYRVYRYLGDTDLSHVFCVDSGGLLFYSAIAKSLGVALQHTCLVTLAVCPTLKRLFCSEKLPRYPQILGRGYMERHALELSDLVLASRKMDRWMREAGYQPRSVSHQFNSSLIALGEHAQDVFHSEQLDTIAIIVHLVPFHVLKVLILGLTRHRDRLSGVQKIKLLFKGEISGVERAKFKPLLADLPFDVVHESFNRLADLITGSEDGETAYVLYSAEFLHRDLAEYCLRKGLAFIFCDEEARSQKAYENEYFANPGDFVDALVRIKCFSAQEREEERLERKLAIDFGQFEPELVRDSPPGQEEPLVSVCVVHHQRPEFLARVLISLAGQHYKNFEVIVVDDGSPSSEVQEQFADLANQYRERNWKFLKQSNRWLGAARNYAVSQARGEYIVFMDDDNIATADLVGGYVRAIENGNKDILTCFSGLFEESGFCAYTNNAPTIKNTILPLGGAVAHGYFENIFGDAACIVRSEVFKKLGGFWHHYGLPKEDHDFFARSVDQGFQLEVLPVQLFYYRKAEDGMMETSRRNTSFNFSVNMIFSNLNITSPFISRLEMRALLQFGVASWYQRPGLLAQFVDSGSLEAGLMKKILCRMRVLARKAARQLAGFLR